MQPSGDVQGRDIKSGYAEAFAAPGRVVQQFFSEITKIVRDVRSTSSLVTLPTQARRFRKRVTRS